MKFLLTLLSFLTINLTGQKLIVKCDTMYKISYSQMTTFGDAIESRNYEVLKYSEFEKEIIINFKTKKVKYGYKTFKIVEVLEPEVGIFHILKLKRRGTEYDLFIGDNCLGGLLLILRYFEEGDIICRYFPSVQLSEIK